jgi:hypothetical protein
MVTRQFSPILIQLLKHSRNFTGVQKFVLEKPSYMFFFGLSFVFENARTRYLEALSDKISIKIK